jgi:hypothetical protein
MLRLHCRKKMQHEAAAVLLIGVFGLILDCGSAGNRPMLNEGNRVMKIEFKRSGGFSPITNASGVVEFTDGNAEVRSSNGTYSRQLAPDEVAKLRTAADPATLAATAGTAGSSNDALRDGFQYDITVTAKDGKQQSLRINTAGPSSNVQNLSSGSAHLLQWIQGESQKILTHRATAR